MKTSPEQLRQWMEEAEGVNLEFKEAKRRFHFEKLLKLAVALANEGGGKIILGVTDKRPRRIVGSQAFEEPGRTEAGLHDRLHQRIAVEELATPQGRVVIVHVPSRRPGTAWHLDGAYLKRAGDELTAMSELELRTIFAETAPDFSAQVCEGASLKDLDSRAIRDFRDRWSRRSGDSRKETWSDQKILADAELLIDGGITFAALILFGTRQALGRWLAQAECVFEYRSSEASGPAADRAEYREGFFLWHEAIWEKINLRNERQNYQDGLFRVDLPTFDEVPVREALLNAIAHRDYRLGGSVFVRQYTHRLEVVSPGGFPAGITTENILHQQNPRNRRLAEALARCGLIERSGQGINLMFETAIRQGKPLPSFKGTSDHEVRVTLEGLVTSPEFVRFMERLGDAKLRAFATEDFLAMDYLRRDQRLPADLRERLPGLVAAGAVESVGRGKGTRYLLSRSLYGVIGASGEYTRRKGLDRETNKALLETHLQLKGGDGAPLSELRQVLPALSESMVQRLLHELRAEGRIHLRGQRRWARWVMGPTPAGDS